MLVGDVAGNAQKIVAAAERACSDLDTDLLVLPELTLSGYPPEDLLFHRGFRVAVEKGMAAMRGEKSSPLPRTVADAERSSHRPGI